MSNKIGGDIALYALAGSIIKARQEFMRPKLISKQEADRFPLEVIFVFGNRRCR